MTRCCLPFSRLTAGGEVDEVEEGSFSQKVFPTGTFFEKRIQSTTLPQAKQVFRLVKGCEHRPRSSYN